MFNSLHKHDGRGIGMFALLFRMYGSVVPRCLPVALFSSCLASLMMIFDRFELVDKAMLPIMRHPISVQMFATVLGYVIVLRSNLAVLRYFEGMSHVQLFGSKWVDALSQLCAFIRTSAKQHSKAGRTAEIDELKRLQFDLLHFFSLLHALAVNSLQVTQLDMDEDEFFSRMQVAELPMTGVLVEDEDVGQEAALASMQNSPLKLAGKQSAKRSSVGNIGGVNQAQSGTLPNLTILGKMEEDELKMLEGAEDKVDLVHAWILESVSEATLNQIIVTQSPLVSRVYQELSNGMLGYNQAYKIALVQFPFAFAQLLTMFLVAFIFACPTVTYIFTGGEFLTPALCGFCVLGFWGIHEIAVEVENPFGIDPNQLPLVPIHESILEGLYEATRASSPFGNRSGPSQQVLESSEFS